jgi:glutamine amidotransferase
MVAVIDYGIGNTGSICKMIEKLGYETCVTNNELEIRKSERIVLPGVGSFDNAAKKLHETGLISLLSELALQSNKPFLGICLGMQLLFKSSDEGIENGLGWLDGRVIKFDHTKMTSEKIPHMGWNTVNFNPESPLFKDINNDIRFYFTHSFHVANVNESEIIGMTNFGYDFICAVQKNNIFGVQFHPEKSHKFGLQLMQKFLEIKC